MRMTEGVWLAGSQAPGDPFGKLRTGSGQTEDAVGGGQADNSKGRAFTGRSANGACGKASGGSFGGGG